MLLVGVLVFSREVLIVIRVVRPFVSPLETVLWWTGFDEIGWEACTLFSVLH